MPISQMSGPNCHKGGSWSIHLVFAAAFFVSLLLVSVVRAELATPQEMEQVCQNWLVQVTYERGAWAGEIDPHIIQTHEITEDGALLARYYDISPGGFVVVPALKEMVPVKAYSEESVLDERQEGGFLQLLRDMLSTRQELYINAFGTLDAAQPGAGDAVFGRGQRSMWDRFTKSTEEFEAELESSKGRMRAQAGPLLTSSWHQRAPYSNLCPMGDGGRCVVGCVATATAQIINFWQWPSSGLGSHSYIWEGDNSCSTLMVPPAELSAVYSDDYDWAHMPDSCDGGCSPADRLDRCFELSVRICR